MNRRAFVVAFQGIGLVFALFLASACNAINEQVAEIATQTAGADLNLTPTSDGVLVPTEVTLSPDAEVLETATIAPSPSPFVVDTPTVFVPPAPAATSTPAPTQAPPPTPCPYAGRYAALYVQHGHELGCFRKSNVVGGTGLAQGFTGGWMYWDSVTGRIYAFSDNRVAAIYDTSTWPVADPNGISCPEAQVSNIRGVFSQAWCEIGQISLMLGPAVEAAELVTLEVEQFTYGSIVQEGGDMFLMFNGVWREVVGEPIEQVNFDFQTATAEAKVVGLTATAAVQAQQTNVAATSTTAAQAQSTASAAVAGQTATAAAAPTATVEPTATVAATVAPSATVAATVAPTADATATSAAATQAAGTATSAAVTATQAVVACQTATIAAVTAAAPVATVDPVVVICP